MGKKKDAKAGGKGLRKPTDRRQFLKVAGIGGLSAASLYLLGCAAEAVTTTQTVTAPGTTTTVTGPGVTTTVTAPGVTTTVTTGPGTTLTTTAPGVTTTVTATVAPEEITWDYDADIVVVGAGATGIPAAIRGRDAGVSVIVVEQNYDIGGRVINSGGVTCIGGGDWLQERESITVYGTNTPDSPEILFKDMVDWTAVREDGVGTYMHNDRDQMRAHADNGALTRQFLTDNGVEYPPAPTVGEGPHGGMGVSAPRRARGEMEGMSTQGPLSPQGAAGSAQIRPLEASARAKGVQFMLNRQMEEIYRENPLWNPRPSGRILGIRTSYTPRIPPGTNTRLESYRSEGNIDERGASVNIRANKAVIICTSGVSGNMAMRRAFDPRLGDANQMTNQPYTSIRGQSGIGRLASMAIGATLWSVAQQFEHRLVIRYMSRIGNQHAYHSTTPDSPVFGFARSTGINIGGAGREHIVNVNQMGNRFYNERDGGWPAEAASPPGVRSIPDPWIPWDWRNCRTSWMKETYSKGNYPDAALMMNEGSTAPDWTAGPVWAIFDAAAVARREWDINPPYTADDGFFFSANTLAELAGKIIQNQYSTVAMPAANLESTIARFNGFVDSGVDLDFERPAEEMQHKIETPPFYAAYNVLMVHDSYGGLRINQKGQVHDLWGDIIPSLYAGGEVTGGGEQHGLGRVFTQGYYVGTAAPSEPSW